LIAKHAQFRIEIVRAADRSLGIRFQIAQPRPRLLKLVFCPVPAMDRAFDPVGHHPCCVARINAVCDQALAAIPKVLEGRLWEYRADIECGGQTFQGRNAAFEKQGRAAEYVGVIHGGKHCARDRGDAQAVSVSSDPAIYRAGFDGRDNLGGEAQTVATWTNANVRMADAVDGPIKR